MDSNRHRHRHNKLTENVGDVEIKIDHFGSVYDMALQENGITAKAQYSLDGRLNNQKTLASEKQKAKSLRFNNMNPDTSMLQSQPTEYVDTVDKKLWLRDRHRRQV